MDKGGQFTDALTLLADDLLGSGSQDDDFGSGRRGDLDHQTSITILSQLAAEKLYCESKKNKLQEEYKKINSKSATIIVTQRNCEFTSLTSE